MLYSRELSREIRDKNVKFLLGFGAFTFSLNRPVWSAQRPFHTRNRQNAETRHFFLEQNFCILMWRQHLKPIPAFLTMDQLEETARNVFVCFCFKDRSTILFVTEWFSRRQRSVEAWMVEMVLVGLHGTPKVPNKALYAMTQFALRGRRLIQYRHSYGFVSPLQFE